MVNIYNNEDVKNVHLNHNEGHINDTFKLDNYDEINKKITELLKKHSCDTKKEGKDDTTVVEFSLNVEGMMQDILKDKTKEEKSLILTGLLLEKRTKEMTEFMENEYQKHKMLNMLKNMDMTKFDLFD